MKVYFAEHSPSLKADGGSATTEILLYLKDKKLCSHKHNSLPADRNMSQISPTHTSHPPLPKKIFMLDSF